MVTKHAGSESKEIAEQKNRIEINTKKGAAKQNQTEVNAKKNITEQQNPSEPNVEYVVGYKKPPIHTRFKPGQSGNSRGRPRKKSSETIKGKFKEIFGKKIKANISGRTTHIDGTETAFLQLRNMLSKGDPQALRIFVQLIKALDIGSESDNPNRELQALFEALRAGPVDTPGS